MGNSGIDKLTFFTKKFKTIPSVSIDAVFWRMNNASRKDQILDSGGSFLYGGKYNKQYLFGALYFSDSHAQCLAERSKLVGNKYTVLPPQVIGKFKVTLGKVLDLTDSDILKKLKIEKKYLTRPENLSITQLIGIAAVRNEFDGILAPSATTEDGVNLIMFHPKENENIHKIYVRDY